MADGRSEQVEFMWRDGNWGWWDSEGLRRVLRRVMVGGTGLRIGDGGDGGWGADRIRGVVMGQMEWQDGDDEGRGH